MSRFNPDIFENLKNNGFAYLGDDPTIKAEEPLKKEVVSSNNLIAEIQAYSDRFIGDEKDVLDYAQLLTVLSNNAYKTNHLTNVIFTLIMACVKRKHPNMDFTEIEDALEDIKTKLDMKLKDEQETDNNLILPALLGITEKLL